ncbi:MAG: protein kinase [Labilithrix sp.]|nr:protein kinase [Labilithrix sp.]
MPDPPSLVGRTIAQRYCIEQLVGGGAMGDVYRARHVGLGSDVAVKIMRASVADASSFKERFYREAKAASRLAHPNSVRVLDYGEEPDGLVYLVMEFLRGRDLLDVLATDQPLSEQRMVDILAQTLAAISTAHGHGIVHRDLKPENIMIVPDEDEDGRDCVKVCDFGIAKLVDARAFKSHEDVRTALTTGNAIIGTPEYMSPEQARGEALDARSDLYSVGVILYRMLTGRLPFDAENAIGVAVKHIVEEPVPPSRVVDSPNPRLEAICMRALRKDPRDRFATAKEMRAELRAALGGGPSGTYADPASGAGRPSGGDPASGAGRPSGGDPAVRGVAASTDDPALAATIGDGVSLKASPPTKAAEPDPSDIVVPLDSSRRVLGLALLAALAGLVVTAGAFAWATQAPDVSTGAGLVAPAASSGTDEAATTPAGSDEAPATTGGEPRPPPASTGAHATAGAPPRIGGQQAHAGGQQAHSSGQQAHAGGQQAHSGGQPAHTDAPTTNRPSPTAPPAAPSSAPPPAPATAPDNASPPAAPEYRPANALVAREPLIAERVQRDVLDRKLAELAPRLNDCYRDSLFIAGRPVGGRAEIHMSIDAAGHVVSVVSAPQLPPFQRCASRLVSSIVLPAQAVEAGGGTAEQGLKLTP